MSDAIKPVVSMADAPAIPFAPDNGAKGFGATLQRLGPLMGSEKLGVMRVTLAPGMRAFPHHCHHANEEMYVILEGLGEYRLGAARHVVKAGDLCAAPAGGAETAHQMINTGAADLVYLVISTMNDPDICEYPDSGKFLAVAVGAGGDFFNSAFKELGRPDRQVGYWDGEGDANDRG